MEKGQERVFQLSNYIIPKPVALKDGEGTFYFTKDTKICIKSSNPKAGEIGRYLAEILRTILGYDFPLDNLNELNNLNTAGNINLIVGKYPADKSHIEDKEGPYSEGEIKAASTGGELGAALNEGYELIVNDGSISIIAENPAGLFYGVQTLRQLLPPQIKRLDNEIYDMGIRAVSIEDYPRFSWRGAMLDVSRNFFSPSDVMRFIDFLAIYKMNRLHLHLSDDQGWRIAIDKWPNLTLIGGGGAVKNGNSGFYTKKDYKEIVDYGKSRFVTIVPEIDLPGHTNAALASYPELNPDNKSPALYDGVKVGFSSLWANMDITYKFIEDVIGELAQMTPGPYIHAGGDEAWSTSHEDYVTMVTKIQDIVEKTGKIMVGWEEIAAIALKKTTLVQIWKKGEGVENTLNQSAKMIMSPSARAYIDMSYNLDTPKRQTWAAHIDVKDGYDWDPVTYFEGVEEKDILGMECPLWTEYIWSFKDAEYFIFPRLPGYGEIGWSPKDKRTWEDYRIRLASHAQRWDILNINYYPSKQIDWQRY